MHLGIATDHGGFGLKQDLAARLRAAGHDVFGASAPLKALQEEFGFEPKGVAATVKELLGRP